MSGKKPQKEVKVDRN